VHFFGKMQCLLVKAGMTMELLQVIVYADIGEVRMESRAAECTKLLKEGWVLLGVYPLTTLGDMTEAFGSEAQARRGGAKGNKAFL
jgi:hypothetical protein